MADVVGVVFPNGIKTYYFDPAGLELVPGRSRGRSDGSSGPEIGQVVEPPHTIEDSELPAPLKKVTRLATGKDLEAQAAARGPAQGGHGHLPGDDRRSRPRHEAGGRRHRLRRREDHLQLLLRRAGGLPRAGGRSGQGPQDAHRAAPGGGARRGPAWWAGWARAAGACAAPCSRRGDEPVSIRMAKEQNLPLNPAKISGLCGRLMCCLKYEQEQYVRFRKEAPRQGDAGLDSRRRGRGRRLQRAEGRHHRPPRGRPLHRHQGLLLPVPGGRRAAGGAGVGEPAEPVSYPESLAGIQTLAAAETAADEELAVVEAQVVLGENGEPVEVIVAETSRRSRSRRGRGRRGGRNRARIAAGEGAGIVAGGASGDAAAAAERDRAAVPAAAPAQRVTVARGVTVITLRGTRSATAVEAPAYRRLKAGPARAARPAVPDPPRASLSRRPARAVYGQIATPEAVATAGGGEGGAAAGTDGAGLAGGGRQARVAAACSARSRPPLCRSSRLPRGPRPDEPLETVKRRPLPALRSARDAARGRVARACQPSRHSF